MQFDRQIEGIDKAEWGNGPWHSEPDLAEWRDEATGLPCLALRHPRNGHWCGYIAVAADHPWTMEDWSDYEAGVEVHGGITFGPARCQPEREGDKMPWHRVCHVPRADESEDVRWFGFDCGHSGYHDADLEPGGDPCWHKNATYRDLDFVVEQCALLAKQAKEASSG